MPPLDPARHTGRTPAPREYGETAGETVWEFTISSPTITAKIIT